MKFPNKIFLTMALSMLTAAELEGGRRGRRGAGPEKSNTQLPQEAPQDTADAASSSEATPNNGHESAPFSRVEALAAARASFSDRRTSPPSSIGDEDAQRLVGNLLVSSSDDEDTLTTTRGGMLTRPSGNGTPEESPRSHHSESSGIVVDMKNNDAASPSERTSHSRTDSDESDAREFRAEVVSKVNAPASSSALSSIAGNGTAPIQQETHTALTSAASAPAAASSNDTGAGTGVVEEYFLATGSSSIPGSPVSQSSGSQPIENENSFDLQWNKEILGQLDLPQCATPSNFTTNDLLSATRKSADLNRFIWNLLKFDPKGSMAAIKECSNVQEAIRKLVQHGIDKMMDRNKPVARYVVDPELEKLSSDNGYNNEASSSIITTKNVAIAAVIVAAAGGAYYYRNEIKAGAKKAYDKSKQGINWLLGKEDELKKQQEAFNKANEDQKNKNRSWFGFGK